MFAIRDDDTSFWTTAEELDSVYGKYLGKGFKISLAVVPFSYRLYNRGDRSKLYIGDERRSIADNQQLVSYLRKYVNSGQIEIMLHGYDHSYCIKEDGKPVFLTKRIREKYGEISSLEFLPESVYKDDSILYTQFKEGKKLLETLFSIEVKTFVPPSNALRKTAVDIVSSLGMNISGTMLSTFNRRIDRYSLGVYFRKSLWKITGHQYTYPYLMNFKGHKELVGHPFTPSIKYNDFISEYNYCIERNCDFTLATHYWELLKDEKLNKQLNEFLDEFVTVKDSALLFELMEEKRL